MDGVELVPVEVFEALERGAVVVTGNQRAARTLRRGFDLRCREIGLESWRPAEVLAWEAWTAGLWRGLVVEGRDGRLLLNRSQEHAVWRTVLEADEELASLQTHDALAEMAAEAWRLVWSYVAQTKLRGAGGNSDARAFQRWAGTMERVCRVEGFLTQAQLEEVLCGAVEKRWVEVGAGGVVLVGFDGLTPAQARLVGVLREAGVSVVEMQVGVVAEQRLLVDAADGREELEVAARWVRGFLEERPGARLAVIVPGLEGERREIDRVFREVLAPELEDIRAGNEVGPYEFSLGVRLAETPMVVAAMDLLRWVAEALPLERVSALLLSPYFAMVQEERGARAEFDAFVLRKRRTLRPDVSLGEASRLVAQRARESASPRSGESVDGRVGESAGQHGDESRRLALPRLAGALRRMVGVAGRLEGTEALSHAEWAERMREVLREAGWGASTLRGETSLEFQTRERWEGVLDELATLDFDGEKVEYAQAMAGVERIARQTVFAPESREAPVQMMGPLEAAGGRFDAVCFLRAGELSWPMETRVNSLLPWGLQRELGMPGADVGRDAESAWRTTDRIARSGGVVVFSYARESEEGRQRASALLVGGGRLEGVSPDLEFVTANDLVGAKTARAVVEVEEVEDTARVGALPDMVVRGGARVLELQAACGFRAFAEHRLWGTELERVEPGMDARESGTVVHKALEEFWREVKTQEALRSMTEEEREGVLDWSIAEGLKRAERASETAWDGAYVEVQRARLRRLLVGWLELEAERAVPFEVKASETEFKDVRVGPLRLSVRMDRVDVVEGGEVLIDYKTGAATPNDWLGERPDAPQLPLYAVLSDAETLQGVGFGLVRAGEGRELRGFAVADGVLPKRTKLKEAPTLEAQVERWREVLVALAEEFARGEARVRPKAYPGTCARCGQRLLCRLDVSALEIDEDGEDTAEVERG